MERLEINLTKHLDKTALIQHKHAHDSEVIKYKDLLKQILKVGLVLENESLSKSESITIGIDAKKSPAVIAILLAIIEADFAFCFVSKDNEALELDKLGIKYLFTDGPADDNLLILRNSLEVFGQNFYFRKTKSESAIRMLKDNNDPMNRLCYTITTSGTTGQKKIVRVPYSCIKPNVVGLQKIFRLDRDVIYSSAPCTFDVFVLDLFLALHSGSALMIIDEKLRYSDESMKFMFSTKATGATFLQITPSLFQRYGAANIRKILHPSSSLKFLVLGGEQFPPTKEVLTWQNWDETSRKRIFNIYGTTEMSCWASIHEVTKDDLLSGEVALGDALDQTNFGFTPDLNSTLGLEEVILASSTRISFVDDKNCDEAIDQGLLLAYPTGDLVRRCKDKIFFFGRKNDIIKKFGERINLGQIESVSSEVVPAVACVHTKKKIVLFVKTEDDQVVGTLKRHLHAKLKSSEVPDEVRKISFFPLSENGKVCKQRLREIYKDLLREDRERRIEAEESFLEAINQILNLQLGTASSSSSDEPDGKRMRTDMDSTFKALGGTSFDALRISMKLEDQTGLSNGLLPKLLGESHSIRDICRYLKDLKPSDSQFAFVHPQRVASANISKIVKRFDLHKCIDASPTVVWIGGEPFVSVGSHSHRLITVNARTLELQSEASLGDRIEGEVSAMDEAGLVGCYDGNLHSFDLRSGGLNWKFESGGMIKSKPLVVGDRIIFGNYNYEMNLRCIRQTAGDTVELEWEKLIGTRGILAAPLLIDSASVLICTLDGTCELLNIDGTTIWSKKLDSPIFSSPQKVPGRDEIIVAEVSKKVHCLDFDGNFLWNFDTDGHIFSSFLFHQESESETKILFGCHDKKLRCLNYNHQRQSVYLDWSADLQSQIYGTPAMTSINTENFVISCATDGSINFVKLSNGTVRHTHKLPGDIFSSPKIFERTLFVGCRDNFLYCIQF